MLGWETNNRQVDLTIDGSLKGNELLKKMNSWFTADVYHAIDIFKRYGTILGEEKPRLKLN